MAGFLDQIEPVKQSALAELRAATDLAALEQARVSYLGSNGKFTALMKQLGGLAKEEKPAAGKAINSAKVELEAALAQRRGELELKRRAAAGTDRFHPARTPPCGRQAPSADAGYRGYCPQLPQDRVRGGGWAGGRGRVSLL